jgi:hypothetical protein
MEALAAGAIWAEGFCSNANYRDQSKEPEKENQAEPDGQIVLHASPLIG